MVSPLLSGPRTSRNKRRAGTSLAGRCVAPRRSAAPGGTSRCRRRPEPARYPEAARGRSSCRSGGSLWSLPRRISGIRSRRHHPRNPRCRNQFRARIARFAGNIHRCVDEVFPVAVDERVAFGVDGDAVVVGRSRFAAGKASGAGFTPGLSGWRSVVTRRANSPIFDYDGSDFVPFAIGSGRYHAGDIQEILVKRRAHQQ